MYVPKVYTDFMKENLVLQVYIPFKHEHAEEVQSKSGSAKTV